MNLLVFKTNFLGDNVVFLPVVQELRRRFPAWRIWIVTNPGSIDLYAGDLPFQQILSVRPEVLKRAWRRPAEFVGWAHRLRRCAADASLVSYDQTSTAHALAWIAGGHIRVGGAGLQIRLRRTLTHQVAWQPGWNIARWNWEMARTLVHALGARDWPETPPKPDLAHLIRGVQRNPHVVAIHPGCKRHYGRWPIDRFLTLAGRLTRTHEVHWIDAAEFGRPELPPYVIRTEAPDVAQLARVLAEAALFVGNNSGPMHVANALGTPLIAITGPMGFAWDPGWQAGDATVLRIPELACQPCDNIQYLPARCENSIEPDACVCRWSVDRIEEVCRNALALQR